MEFPARRAKSCNLALIRRNSNTFIRQVCFILCLKVFKERQHAKQTYQDSEFYNIKVLEQFEKSLHTLEL